jgi:curli biogenesis system outer membrane secretion channel CsgG
MCLTRGFNLGAAALSLALMLLAPGCSTVESFSYNDPPTVAPHQRPSTSGRTGERAVVFGHFRDPQVSSVGQWDVGSGMSEAMARTALNHGAFDAWIDPPLADSVEALIALKETQRAQRVAEIRKTHEYARYVVFGRVTDFAHTADLARDTRRRGLFGRKNEAIVAIQFNVFDLEAERVVAADHVYGVAGATKTPAKELYKGLAFGSYVFWNTPLGKASEEAIENAVDAMHRALPVETLTDPDGGRIRIARQISSRRVELSVDEPKRIADGQRYYVWRFDEEAGEWRPVMDVDRDVQIEAVISRGGGRTIALLTGKKAVEIELKGAALRAEAWAPAPAEPLNAVAEGGSPDDVGGG